ncbi:DHHA1 domain-containing protein [Planococcus sp. N064]|uniref:DHHA1 domain-containing protein n=1 Tax=Planococcus liqunii TaxID=3058394 RepID=A0ABT8MNZ9_9BACL|nr:DHHA1 domain-containing protein [Planococcus sp. N064]MDN7226626.1 DHHA1 domain-containing protein [Planococcus sp. N064]
MTSRLYYEDSELSQAMVNIVASGEDENGTYAVLDQTCFYPEGGGQPSDTGYIGEVRVVDVQSVKDEIRHYTADPLPTGSFKAEIEWKRRWDHMQQHAGQHVLSAVLDDHHHLKTASFHLGEERVSIDLNATQISNIQLQQAERAANEIIRKHLPISTQWVSDVEAQTMALRKPPAVSGEIRLVKIDGVDLNACGGTHPKNTADIGMIKIIGTEKAKGGTRVYFLCGNRAMDHFNLLLDQTNELVQKLNAPLADLPTAADALLREKAEQDKEMKELRTKLLEAEAQMIQPESGSGIIQQVFSGRPVKEVQQLARLAVAQHPEAVLLFLIAEDESIRFVCAKGEEAEGNMKTVLQELLQLTDGKGGGNAELAQGGGKTVHAPDVFFQTFQSSLKNIEGIL